MNKNLCGIEMTENAFTTDGTNLFKNIKRC